MRIALEIAVTLAVSVGLYFLLRIVSRRQKRLYVRFICDLLRIIVVILGLTAILGSLLDLSKIANALLAGGGLFLAILTFAAQKVLNNILSGFSISASKPFEIGQKIRVLQGGTAIAEGIVRDITLRHTVIDTYDGQSCIVPNGVLSESVIINTNYTAEVGNFLEVEVSYNDDMDRVFGVLLATIDAEPLVVRHSAPLVTKYLAEGVLVKTTLWTRTLNDNFIACSNIRKELLRNFREAGITIPYRTVTIDMPKQKEET